MTNVEEISVGEGLIVIDKHMLDEQKYYRFLVVNALLMRAISHPLNFLRIRHQVQKRGTMYNGATDVIRKTWRSEGVRGFTKGGLVNFLQICPWFVYANTLENTRSQLKQNTSLKTSYIVEFLAGGLASFMSCLFSIPIDIIYQHLIIDGQFSPGKGSEAKKRIFIPDSAKARRFGALRYIYSYIREKEGIKGFWKGSSISIVFYGFNSGMWWVFYSMYRDQAASILPASVPLFCIHAGAGALAGNTNVLLTNWMDVIRVTVQTEISSKKEDGDGTRKRKGIRETGMRLWSEEGYKFMFKGLTARMALTSFVSPLLICGYELSKQLSLKEEYKNSMRR